MEKTYLERLFSAGRLNRFYQSAPHDVGRAAALYAANIQLSESLYPSLTVAEVTLRNALHRQLSYLFKTSDWYLRLGQLPGLADVQFAIDGACDQLRRRGESLTADKIVAELTFGFWVRLFNRSYENVLWKQLRLAFPHLPKADRQRGTVSGALNGVRTLRNRVYHNEPICWNLRELEAQHAIIVQLLAWLEPQLVTWLQPIDRFPTVLATEQQRRDKL